MIIVSYCGMLMDLIEYMEGFFVCCLEVFVILWLKYDLWLKDVYGRYYCGLRILLKYIVFYRSCKNCCIEVFFL